MRSRWSKAIAARFKGREDAPIEDAAARFWAGCGIGPLQEFFDLVKRAYGISAGLLRPEDSIETLLEAVADGGVIGRAFFDAWSYDREFELLDELTRRMARAGRAREEIPMSTIGDYIREWCGPTRNR